MYWNLDLIILCLWNTEIYTFEVIEYPILSIPRNPFSLDKGRLHDVSKYIYRVKFNNCVDQLEKMKTI